MRTKPTQMELDDAGRIPALMPHGLGIHICPSERGPTPELSTPAAPNCKECSKPVQTLCQQLTPSEGMDYQIAIAAPLH